jgi:hypothetical protein
MKLIQKIKCKLAYHNDELLSVMIRPVIVSRWDYLNDIILPEYYSHMWKCKNCGKEKVIYK